VYDTEESCCLPDYCVISYTPTVGTLLSSRAGSVDVNVNRQNVKVLLASASEPRNLLALPAARQETEIVSKIVPGHLLLTSISDKHHECVPNWVDTAEDVLRLLPSATILHFACHGIQNTSNPLESSFVMHDRMVQVGDLVRLNLPNARLAFLSACETALGDLERPDEVLHLAATMLYAGFKSVVGTMWSMGDVDGPIVAEIVYRDLFAGDGVLDFDVVPYALDTAVRKLRAQGLEPSRWAPYIHIGM
jgi:CHAT domain-containing protein